MLAADGFDTVQGGSAVPVRLMQLGALLRKLVCQLIARDVTVPGAPLHPHVVPVSHCVEAQVRPLRGARRVFSQSPDRPSVIKTDPDASVHQFWEFHGHVLQTFPGAYNLCVEDGRRGCPRRPKRLEEKG